MKVETYHMTQRMFVHFRFTDAVFMLWKCYALNKIVNLFIQQTSKKLWHILNTKSQIDSD